VIVPSDYMVGIMIQNGLLAPVNKDAVPNLVNLAPRFTELPYDPGPEYSAAYQYGTTGLGLNLSVVGEDFEPSWALLFDPELTTTFPGGVSVLNDPREAMGAALKYLGYSLNDTELDHLQEAADVIAAAQEGIATFDSDQYDEALVSGEVAVAHGYSGNMIVSIGDSDDPENYAFKAKKGLSRDVVVNMSKMKAEPQWMTDYRLKALDIFYKKPMPTWGADLSTIDFDNIYYYVKPSQDHATSWDDVSPEVKRTFDKLGIPEAEQKFLAGVGAQYESEMVYHAVRKDLEEKGVIFLSMDEGLLQHPEMVKQYFGTIIPSTDNKFAALNSAVWSGGSFIYVPKGVKVEMPLQAYFRINSKNMGQFERTLIIVDEDAYVHYVEGCTAPTYSSDSLHSAVVEIIVKKGGRCRYTTIQNWSTNVYNLVTKRAAAYENATMEWVDGNLGSKITMKYPAIYLLEPGAHGEVLSIAFAGAGQQLDAGGKVVHGAPYTTSKITSKSISKGGGRSSYRGLLKVYKGAHHSKSNVVCDALLIDDKSRSDTYPVIEIDEDEVTIGHEASVSKVGEDQLFYLMSRGLSQEQAASMVVGGFIEPLVKELPMEYAVELNRLVQLQMEGSIG